jgi:hypothetical protein
MGSNYTSLAQRERVTVAEADRRFDEIPPPHPWSRGNRHVHHLDSPLARKGARLNITDHYVLDSGFSTVLITNVRTSLAGDLDAGSVPPRSPLRVQDPLEILVMTPR